MCACGLKHAATRPCDDLVANGYMQTFTGRVFCRLDPRPEDVTGQDIARHLAAEARYNGATSRPYSVAQHSVLVARRVRELLDDARVGPRVHNLRVELAALLHDAGEAYLKDIPRSLKRLPAMAAAYKPLEEAVDAAVFEKFGIPAPSLCQLCWPLVVKRADEDLYAAEVRDLLARPGWFPKLGQAPGWHVEAWSWHKAEQVFLEELGRLVDALEYPQERHDLHSVDLGASKER